MVFIKFTEITKKNAICSQCNIFYNYEYFFFQPAFWSLFNHRQSSQLNQEQSSMCYSSPCFLVLLSTPYGPLQCFSTYFCKLKEIGVLRSVFLDYIISCDYAWIHHGSTSCWCLNFTFLVEVLPPPFHYSLGSYLYLFLLYILLSQNW